MAPRQKSLRTFSRRSRAVASVGCILLNFFFFFLVLVSGKTKHKAPPALCGCHNVTIAGSRVHTTRMGNFVLVPGVIHDGHAVYINSNNEYLYFYAPIWLVGNDYTKNMAGVRSNGNGLCPTDVVSWEHYVDAKWTKVPLKVTCRRAPKKPSSKKKKPRPSVLAKKIQKNIHGKWKLIALHGDKQIKVKRSALSSIANTEEVLMHYRKSVDRPHKVAMFHKDCDTPLPPAIAEFDSTQGAIIDDIQAVAVLVDVDLAAAQRVKLWEMCLKMALLGDATKGANPKDVATHYTPIEIVGHESMNDLLLERIQILEKKTSSLNIHRARTVDPGVDQRAGKLIEVAFCLRPLAGSFPNRSVSPNFIYISHQAIGRLKRALDQESGSTSANLEQYSNTRRNLFELETKLGSLAKYLEKFQFQQGNTFTENYLDETDSSSDSKPRAQSDKVYFDFEVCHCDIASITENTTKPPCADVPLDAKSPLEVCLSVNSSEIVIKDIMMLQFEQIKSGTKPFLLTAVDRELGPVETTINYHGGFTAVRSTLTTGHFKRGIPAEVEVKGSVFLHYPERQYAYAYDFSTPLLINEDSSPECTGNDDEPCVSPRSAIKKRRKRKDRNPESIRSQL